MDDTHDSQRRSEFVAGLRELADWYEQHPDFPLPTYGVTAKVWPPFDRPAPLADYARQLGHADKEANGMLDEFRLTKHFPGDVKVIAAARREDVCERKVTTETVYVQQPDPELTKDVPLVDVEEERERVEWVCPDSILQQLEGGDR